MDLENGIHNTIASPVFGSDPYMSIAHNLLPQNLNPIAAVHKLEYKVPMLGSIVKSVDEAQDYLTDHVFKPLSWF